MNIIPDLYLVLLQFAPFLAVIFGLKIILFDPMMAYLEERHTATLGVKQNAGELLARAEAQVSVFEKAVEKARQEITEFRTERRAEANTEYQRLIAVSRQQAEAKVSAALAEMHQDAEAARKVLAASADALATDIAQQALGRPLEA